MPATKTPTRRFYRRGGEKGAAAPRRLRDTHCRGRRRGRRRRAWARGDQPADGDGADPSGLDAVDHASGRPTTTAADAPAVGAGAGARTRGPRNAAACDTASAARLAGPSASTGFGLLVRVGLECIRHIGRRHRGNVDDRHNEQH